MDSKAIIAKAYTDYRNEVYRYILYKTGDEQNADDMTQDVFMKLLCYDTPIIWSTVKNLIYKIAFNMVAVYWRRYYVRQDADKYLMETIETSANVTEETVIGEELAMHERKCLVRMAKRRRMVYERRRFFGESAQEIAESLNLSRRTVENHLFLGYKEMRSYISECC